MEEDSDELVFKKHKRKMNIMEVVIEYFKYYKEKAYNNLPCSIDILTLFREKSNGYLSKF